MKKLLVAILWAILLLPFSLFSQDPVEPIINSTLTGQVIDRATKAPVPGAAVKIRGTTHGVSADDHGRFNFVTGQKFPYILIVSSVGYETVEVTVNGTWERKSTGGNLHYGKRRRVFPSLCWRPALQKRAAPLAGR